MKNIFILPNKNIQNALMQLDKTGESCLLVVNNNKKLLGTITDGDLRRYILKNPEMNKTIEKIYNKKPKFLFQNSYSKILIKNLMLKNKIDLIPIIDQDSKVINYYTWQNIFKERKEIKKIFKSPPILIIMAGGKGTRMKPFTNILPKPFIPFKDKTIIESIIEKFTNYGINKIFLSINYKSFIIKAFFKELRPKAKINFIEESKPLGTVGSLAKLKGIVKKDFILTNCDTYTEANIYDLMEFHKKNKYLITIVAAPKINNIPFGVCELHENGNLKKINEKVHITNLINIGLYVINPKILNMIPANKYLDITDLINKIGKSDDQIGIFPIDEKLWKDVGQWDNYIKALED